MSKSSMLSKIMGIVVTILLYSFGALAQDDMYVDYYNDEAAGTQDASGHPHRCVADIRRPNSGVNHPPKVPALSIQCSCIIATFFLDLPSVILYSPSLKLIGVYGIPTLGLKPIMCLAQCRDGYSVEHLRAASFQHSLDG